MDLKKTLKFLKLNESLISTIFGALIVLAIGIYLFNNLKKESQVSSTSATPTPQMTQKGQVPTNLSKTYTVQIGDTLWSIAEKNYSSGYNWKDISDENKLVNPSMIEVGQVLTLPSVPAKTTTMTPIADVQKVADDKGGVISGDTYVVQKGDSLWSVSVRAYGDGYQWTKLAQMNQVKNPDVIYVGEVLNLHRDQISGMSK